MDQDCQLEIDDDEVNSRVPALPLEQIGPLVPNILFRVGNGNRTAPNVVGCTDELAIVCVIFKVELSETASGSWILQ